MENLVVPQTPETIPEKAIRGTVNAAKLIPMTGYGLGAAGGAMVESAAGPDSVVGDLGAKFKDKMLEGYLGYADSMAETSRPEDSFTYSYAKAKEGDWGALGDWVAYNLPNVVAQFGTIVLGGGVIKGVTQVAGKKAVNKIMGGLVKNEAERLALATGKKSLMLLYKKLPYPGSLPRLVNMPGLVLCLWFRGWRDHG